MKRLAIAWSSFPVEHKRRFYQGIGVYALVLACLAIWIAANARSTVSDWQKRSPAANAIVKNTQMAPPPDFPVPFSGRSAAFDQQPYVAIIMSGLGLSSRMTERALDSLPQEVSLAFSPYAADLQKWLDLATRLNRETLIFMPMETAAYPQDDPGPRAVSSRLSDKDNNDNLNWVLSHGKGTVGVINFLGSRFLTDKKRLTPVFDALQKNGSMFIETPATEKSEARAIAAQAGLPYMAVDLQIDQDTAENAIRGQLAKLEAIARERGYAIGIAEPYPLTLNVIKSWSGELGKSGIRLAPLAAVWENKQHHDEKPTPASK
ncbi:MAG: divergent polysaccharide deacetylase family protein [Alphaproteobacteria bacterium]|nr:divergent polysaccharide deacetylase family protein [Alphaproteobacteria bacterium]